MTGCCEICGTATREKISHLELETWDFPLLQKEKKEFYSICFTCFDTHAERQIEKDVDTEVRKQRSLLFEKLVKEGFPCPNCEEPLTVQHMCKHE